MYSICLCVLPCFAVCCVPLYRDWFYSTVLHVLNGSWLPSSVVLCSVAVLCCSVAVCIVLSGDEECDGCPRNKNLPPRSHLLQFIRRTRPFFNLLHSNKGGAELNPLRPLILFSSFLFLSLLISSFLFSSLFFFSLLSLLFSSLFFPPLLFSSLLFFFLPSYSIAFLPIQFLPLLLTPLLFSSLAVICFLLSLLFVQPATFNDILLILSLLFISFISYHLLLSMPPLSPLDSLFNFI